MKIVYHDERGAITGASINIAPDQTRLYINADVEIGPNISETFYVKSGELKRKPPKPDGDFVFDYASEAWVIRVLPPPDIEALSLAARDERTSLLAACDWTQVADAPVDRQAWAAYRQALRDVTLQDGFPLNIIWPNPPES